MDIKQHWSDVAAIGCAVTRLELVELHHCKSGSMSALGIPTSLSKKNSDYLVIPLCSDYHRGKNGIHIIGVKNWETKNGTQINLLKSLGQVLGYDLFEKAGYCFDIETGRYEKTNLDENNHPDLSKMTKKNYINFYLQNHVSSVRNMESEYQDAWKKGQEIYCNNLAKNR